MESLSQESPTVAKCKLEKLSGHFPIQRREGSAYRRASRLGENSGHTLPGPRPPACLQSQARRSDPARQPPKDSCLACPREHRYTNIVDRYRRYGSRLRRRATVHNAARRQRDADLERRGADVMQEAVPCHSIRARVWEGRESVRDDRRELMPDARTWLGYASTSLGLFRRWR